MKTSDVAGPRKLIKVLRISCAGMLFAIGAPGQSGPPVFEAASVKPAPPGKGNVIQRSLGGDAGRINYSNVTLKLLIARAYQVKDFQVTGPDWLDSEGYDVMAIIPDKTPKEQVPIMLQKLLADRFKLAVHIEKRELPVYALALGKNGPKLKEAEPPPGALRMMFGPKGMQLQGNITLDALTNALSNLMNHPVIDATGLKGAYDVSLEFTPDESSMNPRMSGKMAAIHAGPAGDGKSPSDGLEENSQAPSIFSAVQESLGLKLEGRKAPLDIVIVDHAEKTPTEN